MQKIGLLAIIEAKTITGPAKNLLNFAEIMRATREGPRVELSIATFERNGSSEVFLNAARSAAIPVYSIPEAGPFDRSAVERLKKLAQELHPDLVQSHAVKSHFLVRLAGLPKLAPWIAFHHGYTWTDLTMRLYNQLDRWSLRAASRVVTVSQPFREQLVSIGVNPKRVEVLHNAVRPDWGSEYRSAVSRSKLRDQLGIPSNARIILIVGRLSQEKDHQTLLRAFHLLHSNPPLPDMPPMHLLVVGEGPERIRIQQTTADLKLSDWVTLTGQVASAEPYYGIADISVLSSLTEGSPNALLESMAARVPVVATAVGGIPEMVVNNQSALLVSTHDAPAMASAMGSLLSNRLLAENLAENAYRIVLDRFSPAARMKHLIRIYEDVLRDRDVPR